MEIIRGSDPCPCGSGKIFKICCQGKNKEHILHNQKNYSDAQVLKDILNESHEFQIFYNTERKKIHRPIFWIKNFNNLGNSYLPSGTPASFEVISFEDSYEEYFIILRKIPPLSSDTYTIAHEIGHSILHSEGFRGVSWIKREPDALPRGSILDGKISSMCSDLLVDLMLMRYGLDTKGNYIQEFARFKEVVEKINTLPEDPIIKRNLKMYLIIDYTGYLLAFDLFFDKGESIDLFNIFEQKFPEIASEAHSLKECVNEMGYKSLEKMNELNQWIIKKFGLLEELKISKY